MKKLSIIILLLFSFALSGCSRRGAVEFRTLSAVSEEDDMEEKEQQEEETSFSEIPDEKVQEAKKETENLSLYVDISGEVENPGVYELPCGNRVFHAIIAAGGFTDRAETRCVNQAEAVYDGEKIYIYSREEAEQLGGWKQLSVEGGAIADGSHLQGTRPRTDPGGKVNLNQADKEQLMTLAGVGEAKAEAIISYREVNGAFSAIEDVMKVSGIKEKLFEQICDKITV